MLTQDTPVALRTFRDFPPSRWSVFEDPGDEKSWHQSQRFDALKEFYAGRQPSWYATAVRPLAGARRVLDLGAGPALALQELLNQGAEQVLGIDRWPGFQRAAAPETPIVLHDLTLPMPFLGAGSFDAVLSHYVLDYIAPISMRQVLREAHRVLEPDGKLLLYVAAIGLGGNDFTRTSAYDAPTMTKLLQEAGFVDLRVTTSPNGRNTIASARRPQHTNPFPPMLELDLQGDGQLAASFLPSDAADVEIELSGHGRTTTLKLSAIRGATGKLSCCARVSVAPFGAEVQAWVWRSYELVATQALRLDFRPARLAVRYAGVVAEAWSWTPAPLVIETTTDAYSLPEKLRPVSQLTERERGQEGRRLVVEGEQRLDVATISALLGDMSSRFLARRGASMNAQLLDREWRERRLHAVVVKARELEAQEGFAACIWASQRDVPLLIEAEEWGEHLKLVELRAGSISCPLLLVDPVLTGASAGEVPGALLAIVAARPHVYLLLAASTATSVPGPDREHLKERILAGSGHHASAHASADHDEALRYLTERALLMRLRHVNARELADLGRRPPLSDSGGAIVGHPAALASAVAVTSRAMIGPDPRLPLPSRLPRVDTLNVDRAKLPTTVFLTVDAEDTFFDQPRLITGEGLGREFGIYGILDELESRGLSATFFVNVYESERQPPGSIEAIVREIAARGHEVGLHTHQSPDLPFFDRPLFRLGLDEQLRVLRWGVERLEAWSDSKVVSFRAGGYALNEVTFDVLEQLGIRVDSSCFFRSANNQLRQRSVNGVHRRGALVEVPVTSVLRSRADRTVEHRKLDVDWLTSKQLLEGLQSMREHGAAFAMLMMHSFTFIDKLARPADGPPSPRAVFTSPAVFGRVTEIYGPKPGNRESFAHLLDELSRSPDLSVSTLRDALPQLEAAIDDGVTDVVPIVAP